MPFTADISTKCVGNTDAETGKGKLIICRHPDTVGYRLKFGMTDQDIIHIQAKTEFIIQHTIKQTCTDTVIRLYQINPTILTRSEPTGKRSNECLLRIEEERIAQTGIIGPSFLSADVEAALEVVRL